MKPALALGLVFLAAGVGHAQWIGTPDPYSAESEISPQVDPHLAAKIQQTVRERQELFRTRVAIPDAVADDVPLESAVRLAARQQAAAVPIKPPPTPQPVTIRERLLFLAAGFLTAILVIRKLAPGLLKIINAQFNPWATRPATVTELSTKVRAEEDSLSEFLAAFQTGPSTGSGTTGDDAVKDFCERAARLLVTQRQLLRETDRTLDEGGRQKMLAALRWEMHSLRGEAGLPALLPVWQVAFALEGLLKQLTDNAANVTSSSLRTVAGGVDLLADLCVPGLAPDLLARRPLKLLAVDDDPISRKAVSLALKRALNEPDLAENGQAALALAIQQAYDVIFLDVQMPGMDGFELCTRIHETTTNRATPVVFVTCQSDFDTRAQSTLSGGSDLIGKPFLTFEITVKALTLALRGRLEAVGQRAGSAAADVSTQARPQLGGNVAVAVSSETTTDCVQSSRSFASGHSSAGEATESEAMATEFLSRASAHLAPLRETFQAIFQTADEAARQDMLADVFLRLHSFTPKDDLPALHPAIQMSAALDGLVRKLLEHPDNATGSTLVTLAAGVELLHDLCALGPQSDLVTHPPIRLLVVDDDAVARRAVALALQMAFEKPETAESGTAALTLVADRPFDAIFLDVQMPGMDGFEVCSRIRKSAANHATPVVFVTGHNDFKARTRMSASGGSDFVGKPFLISEITVKALTFALRGRLDKLESEQREASPRLANH